MWTACHKYTRFTTLGVFYADFAIILSFCSSLRVFNDIYSGTHWLFPSCSMIDRSNLAAITLATEVQTNTICDPTLDKFIWTACHKPGSFTDCLIESARVFLLGGLPNDICHLLRCSCSVRLLLIMKSHESERCGLM